MKGHSGKALFPKNLEKKKGIKGIGGEK